MGSSCRQNQGEHSRHEERNNSSSELDTVKVNLGEKISKRVNAGERAIKELHLGLEAKDSIYAYLS